MRPLIVCRVSNDGLKDLYVRDEAVCYGVTKRHECKCYEGRDCITDIAPIDTRHLTHHHAADLSELVWHLAMILGSRILLE
jgi:hypothetical protein